MNRETLFSAFMLVLVAVGWNQLYVKPKQEFLFAVAECQGEELGREAWKRCAEEVNEARHAD